MAFRIEHRIGVAAPASEIWDLVYDLEGWKDWTGIYTNASGKIAIGETLEFTFKLGDRVPQSYKGVVYDWVPEHQMAWTTRFAESVGKRGSSQVSRIVPAGSSTKLSVSNRSTATISDSSSW